MLNKYEIQRIERYLAGTADSDDIDWVEEAFADGHENLALKNIVGADWDTASDNIDIEEAELDRILIQLHHFIREKQHSRRKTFVYKLINVYAKIAAVLLIPLVVAGYLYFSSVADHPSVPIEQRAVSTIFAPKGSRVSFNLPDGTNGWLNSGSTLSYPMPFTDNREVTLEGEAWFDVAHNKEYPFTVGVGKSTIKVLGTSFNVNAYNSEKYIEVVLQEGKVEFSGYGQAQKVIMEPSDQLILANNELVVNHVDVSKHKGWTDGKLIFRGDNMAEVARRIERWYDVEIEIADPGLEQFSFRATFENDSLEDVLKFIAMTSPIKYKITQRKQLPDGTFEKTKIILLKKN